MVMTITVMITMIVMMMVIGGIRTYSRTCEYSGPRNLAWTTTMMIIMIVMTIVMMMMIIIIIITLINNNDKHTAGLVRIAAQGILLGRPVSHSIKEDWMKACNMTCVRRF